MPDKKECMTNKILSIRMKPAEMEEFIKIAEECGCNPDTYGFQKDTLIEFMHRTRDFNNDIKERVGTLTSAKRRALRTMIESSTITENFYQNRNKKHN